MKNIDNGVVRLGTFELRIPHLSLDNQCTYIVGPNGAGKSTLLKVILGLVSLVEGEVQHNKNCRFGYVPQNYRSSLLPWMTARENLQLHSVDNSIISDLIKTGFNEIDLDKFPAQLSGGQCQRIAIVREANSNFDILVLDEPFSGLDVKTVPKIGKILIKSIASGMNIILTSHTTLPEDLAALQGFQEIYIERTSDRTAVVKEVKV